MAPKKTQDHKKKQPTKEQTDITKMSVIELQAAGYRESVMLQQAQQNIQIINQELSKR